jgi:hypothetical protein
MASRHAHIAAWTDLAIRGAEGKRLTYRRLNKRAA